MGTVSFMAARSAQSQCEWAIGRVCDAWLFPAALWRCFLLALRETVGLREWKRCVLAACSAMKTDNRGTGQVFHCFLDR